jgi:hypothetical protein
MTTRTWERVRRVGALMLAMATTLAWGERASASCPSSAGETWALEVHSVTVDGVPVRATPWVLLPMSITALPDGRVVMVAQGPHGREEAYYVSAR